jgi:short-subunit dehydrogenase
MAKTIIINGFGTGISTAVAERFGAEGFALALVARNAERLATAAKALQAKGLRAEAFPADLSQIDATRDVIAKVRATLGPITALHWNAYAPGAGDLTAAPPAELRTVYDVAVTSLVAAVQEALPDVRAERGAVLVTNGGLGLIDPKVDAMAAQWGAMGLAVANAAKHKLVGLLAEKLRGDGVFVGQVIVTGTVKGTAWDTGAATIEAKTIATKFWELFQARTPTTVIV